MMFVDAGRCCLTIADESLLNVDQIHRMTTAIALGDTEAFARLYGDDAREQCICSEKNVCC